MITPGAFPGYPHGPVLRVFHAQGREELTCCLVPNPDKATQTEHPLIVVNVYTPYNKPGKRVGVFFCDIMEHMRPGGVSECKRFNNEMHA